jgi:DnaJ-class molecular chaperone
MATYTRRATCQTCRGEGEADGVPCRPCRTYGYVEEQAECPLCWGCAGSGEGPADGTRCYVCHGSGELPGADAVEYDADREETTAGYDPR